MLWLAPPACPSCSSPPTARLRRVLQVRRPIPAPDGYGSRPQNASYLHPSGGASLVTWYQCRGTSVQPKREQDTAPCATPNASYSPRFDLIRRVCSPTLDCL